MVREGGETEDDTGLQRTVARKGSGGKIGPNFRELREAKPEYLFLF